MTDYKPVDVKISIMTLGTMVVKFELPMRLIDDINKAYDDTNKDKLEDFNERLAGKIVEEKSVNDLLTKEMKAFFLNCFKQYLNQCQKPLWHCMLDNAWINEMKASEYNPLHYHTTDYTDIGLSSVLILKTPSNYGKEYAREKNPANGHLEFSGGDQHPLSTSQLRFLANVGEFYVFPYSLLHGVYPFNGTDEVRRTMSYNCNLFKPEQIKMMGLDTNKI